MRRSYFKKKRSLKNFATLTKKKLLILVKSLTRKRKHRKHRKQSGG